MELCHEAGLPAPVVNGVDGYAYHRTRASFERDRARDGRLHTAGYVVLRLTARRLQGDAATAMGQVRVLLAA